MSSAPAQPAPANSPAIPGISVGDLAQDACLPYLGAADAKLLELYISPEIGFDLHALAARCRQNILNLVSWAHSQTIAPWIAAWNTLARQHRLHRNIDRRERAILALSGVLDVIKDPIELRCAASALIRAIDGPRTSQPSSATATRRSGPSLREGVGGGFAGFNLQPIASSAQPATASDSGLRTSDSGPTTHNPEPDPTDLPARTHLALANALNTVLSIREQEMRQRAVPPIAASSTRSVSSAAARASQAAPLTPSSARADQLSPRRGDPDVSIGRGVSQLPIISEPSPLPNPLSEFSVFPPRSLRTAFSAPASDLPSPRPLRTAFASRPSPATLLTAAGLGPGP